LFVGGGGLRPPSLCLATSLLGLCPIPVSMVEWRAVGLFVDDARYLPELSHRHSRVSVEEGEQRCIGYIDLRYDTSGQVRAYNISPGIRRGDCRRYRLDTYTTVGINFNIQVYIYK